MKLNTKRNSMHFDKAKGISLEFVDKSKDKALSTMDNAFFIEKELTQKDETETAGEALNMPTNVFLGARGRQKAAEQKAEKVSRKISKMGDSTDAKRISVKRKAIAKKKKFEKSSKKRLTKGDVFRGAAASGAGAIISESDEENKKALEKAKKISRAPGKVRRGKEAAKSTYQAGRLLTRGGMKAGTAIARAFKAIVAMLGPITLVISALIIVLCIVIVIVAGGIEEEENRTICPYGDMYYWIKWETGTWDPDVAFSMVHGDGGKAYGIQLDYRYGLISFNKWCYQADKDKYRELAPYVTKGSVSLYDQKFASLWKLLYANNKKDFAEKQKNFAFTKYYKPVAKHLKNKGIDLDEYSEVVRGAVLSFAWQHGVNAAKNNISVCLPKKKVADEEAISRLYEKRIALYPACKSRYIEERDYAISLLNYGSIVGGNVIGTDTQKRIVQYALSGNSYGVGRGWCQAWVYHVYKNATGVGNSKCCAAACRDAWATKSGDIPVGAAIYSGPGYRSRVICSCGRNAGHVGIYVGNNRVVSMINGPTVQSLDQWYSWFGYGGWSWNGGAAAN